MTYDLEFHPDALKEWQKLSSSIREQFKKSSYGSFAKSTCPKS